MSSTLAIAAATATLRNLLLTEVTLLDASLADLEVTTQPLDLARKGVSNAQLNLFLYQTVLNGAWRNQPMPGRVRPGERGAPPLALNLHYLVTAYGRGGADDEAISHRVLGGAMSVLHDHPQLERGEIAIALPNNDLGDQFERVKITPLPISIEELSKLWTVFQTNYRVSAAYEVTVILIDSHAPVKAALPVLKRGEEDRGPAASASLPPLLRSVLPPRSQSAARLGEDIVLTGERFVGPITVRFSSFRLKNPVELAAQTVSGAEISVHIPDQAEDASALSRWVPGFYTVTLAAGPLSPANSEVAFALAPRITVNPLQAAPGTVVLTITCAPRIEPKQEVLLLFGEQPVDPKSVNTPADTTQPTTLTFSIPAVAPGHYVARLRVDGVDSIPVLYAGTPPMPAFDPAQTVSVA